MCVWCKGSLLYAFQDMACPPKLMSDLEEKKSENTAKQCVLIFVPSKDTSHYYIYSMSTVHEAHCTYTVYAYKVEYTYRRVTHSKSSVLRISCDSASVVYDK